MNLILKIAAGVFLGALAVLFVVWLMRTIPNRIAKQKTEDEWLRKYDIVNINPEQMTAKCGKSLKEETIQDTIFDETVRALSYRQDKAIHKFEFSYNKYENLWKLRYIDSTMVTVNKSSDDEISPDEVVMMMPCLGK